MTCSTDAALGGCGVIWLVEIERVCVAATIALSYTSHALQDDAWSCTVVSSQVTPVSLFLLPSVCVDLSIYEILLRNLSVFAVAVVTVVVVVVVAPPSFLSSFSSAVSSSAMRFVMDEIATKEPCLALQWTRHR